VNLPQSAQNQVWFQNAQERWEDKSVQVDFDFIDHQLVAVASDGGSRLIPFEAMSVAAFDERFRSTMRELGVYID